MNKTKVILAEDHTIVRNGIKSMLEAEADFEVIGEAVNGLEVLALLETGCKPDIVLSDISMPEMDGLELAKALHELHTEIKVVILSMMSNDKYIFDAFEAGVSGYLLKNADAAEMKHCLRQVAADKEYLCSEIGMRLVRKSAMSMSLTAEMTENLQLTSREKEILGLMAEGLTNNEIADKTFTSRRTIEGHRQSLIEKTGARNTAQLIAFAAKNGLI